MMNLSVLVRKLRSFGGIKGSYKILMVKAFFLSGIARLLILFIHFRVVKKFLGHAKRESSYEINTEEYARVRRIAWAVNHACKYTPWESKCLVKAIVAQRMLKECKIYSTMYLGVRKAQNNMEAHAWLRCGSVFVTGGYEKDEFKEVAKFCNEQ